MTQERDLLRTIAREPDDDAPRLVYADWLEEHGRDDRAAFIRAQVRYAGLKDDSPERRELAFRARQLLEANETEWAKRFLHGPTEWHWSRGFVEMIDAVPEHLEGEGGAEHFDLHPIRRLVLTQLNGKLDALALIPADHRLTALELINDDLDLRALRKLVKVPHLGGLSELSLMFNRLRDSSIDLLCKEPFFQRLSLLRLACNPFSERGRDRLRDHFGGRVSFARERFLGRLYLIRERLRVGWGRELIQTHFRAGARDVYLSVFDHAGTLLRIEKRPIPEGAGTPDRVRLREGSEGIGFHSAPVKIQRFKYEDGAGINDFNWWADAFDRPPDRDRTDALYRIRTWLRRGQFEYDFVGDNMWFDRGGEATST